ncbi:YceI family protein [Bdellovibrio sp. HCB185ZH]|uniref:YceI family protein n=1 Tax=Bdellovibrio sp. HCB185ZH TaxID=3394235 RepID=UPI0039A750DE
MRSQKILTSVLMFSFLATSAQAAKFQIDPAHTNITFKVPHMVISKVKGTFDKFEGSFDFDEKSQKLDNVVVKIHADSINTNQADRDKHLKSPDFLDVAKFPTIEFKGTKVIYENAKPKEVQGKLTVHGVTKDVTLEVEYKGAVTDPMGIRRVGFEIETKLNRKDFGLIWNKALETGGVVVGDNVEIDIEGEAIIPGKAK